MVERGKVRGIGPTLRNGCSNISSRVGLYDGSKLNILDIKLRA
jgi:hypothetical protein